MRRALNSGVIYTGKVGARMAAPKHKAKTKRPVQFGRYRCTGGPLDGRTLVFEIGSDLKTLTFRLHGRVGHYLGSSWVPA
jgi:hypothetical protein